MNRLLSVSVTQFRNYGSAAFSFPQNITCITGPNGSGKTALLDAIYYLCYTKSYFTAQQQYSVQNGTDGFRIEGTFENAVITVKWKGGKKEVSAGGVLYDRIADHIGRYAAVMIAPDDMALINEGSEGRRKWIDSILSQTDRDYLDSLMQYTQVLQQRNAWLKMQATQPDNTGHALDYYNSRLVQTGAFIYARRLKFLGEFQHLLQRFYKMLSGEAEAISIQYTSDLHERGLQEWLASTLQYDLRMQRTTRGVHKDELVLLLNENPLRSYGSQGQKKSFLFAMKLAQYAYLSNQLAFLPILLLDDIFEKLDQHRMEALLRIIQGPQFGQVILTDTHAERVRAAFGAEVDLGFIGLG